MGEGLPDSPGETTRPDTEPHHSTELPTQRPTEGEAPASKPFAGLLAEASGTRKSAPPPAAPSMPTIPAPPLQPVPAAPSVQMESERKLGAYKILGELGSGGMAVVYKALQPALDRLVAIKELRPELMADKQIAARFEREATSLATLQHGNIVHIYDFIREPDGAYIVMEYVEGIDLFDLLHDVGKVPPDVGATIALQLAEGLEYAHYRGIIHRDVKPSNVLISKSGEVKIMDFGIARDPGRSDLTQIGMALGTPAYMAPEQIRGDKTDFRADLFALGIVLYEMLTGQKPWGDDSGGTTIARKVLYEEPTPPTQHVPDLPLALVHIMGTCLAKDPARRYKTTHDLRRELAAYLAHEISIDARQRLVVFLRNRGSITEGEASSFAHASVLYDGVLRRRDLGLPTVPLRALMQPLAVANGLGFWAIVGALALASQASTSFPGRILPLPKERPTIQIHKVAPTSAADPEGEREGSEPERERPRKRRRSD